LTTSEYSFKRNKMFKRYSFSHPTTWILFKKYKTNCCNEERCYHL